MVADIVRQEIAALRRRVREGERLNGEAVREVITQRVAELFVPKRAERMRQSDDTPGITSLTVEAAGGRPRA